MPGLTAEIEPQSLKKLSLKSVKRALDLYSPVHDQFAPPDPERLMSSFACILRLLVSRNLSQFMYWRFFFSVSFSSRSKRIRLCHKVRVLLNFLFFLFFVCLILKLDRKFLRCWNLGDEINSCIVLVERLSASNLQVYKVLNRSVNSFCFIGFVVSFREIWVLCFPSHQLRFLSLLVF